MSFLINVANLGSLVRVRVWQCGLRVPSGGKTALRLVTKELTACIPNGIEYVRLGVYVPCILDTLTRDTEHCPVNILICQLIQQCHVLIPDDLT